MSVARCVSLEALDEVTLASSGGKAAGLARLSRMGLRVPPGFVVIGARPGALPAELERFYLEMGGGPVAVRSSAQGEDGSTSSFAGQYETFLDVEGGAAVAAAVERCLSSLDNQRAEAYREHEQPDAVAALRMSVVVQRMVRARAAGVLFTVDPVSGRRDVVVVDAVPGLGEALVSGAATGDHYELNRDGALLRAEHEGGSPILSPGQLEQLARQALSAEQEAGHPLDLEWAIGDAGLFWLQARPVTALPGDPRELDVCSPRGKSELYTRSNIGEMMPGAVTPLTLSVTGRGIEVGMQRMFLACGALERETEDWLFVGSSCGHLFLNLSTMARMATFVAGASTEQIGLSVCGRIIEELKAEPPRPLPLRLLNAGRYFRLMLGAGSHIAAIERLVAETRFEHDSPEQLYRALDGQLDRLFDAYFHHLASSAGSGAIAGALASALAQGKTPTPEHHAQVAAVLGGAEGVESADVVAGVDRIVTALLATAEGRGWAERELDAGREWLESASAGPAGEEYRRYLARHGHRAVRELELSQREWAADPSPLLVSLRGALRASLAAEQSSVSRQRRRKPGSALPASFEREPWCRLVEVAHAAVRNRERSKSLLVKLSTLFRAGYRDLGRQLEGAGKLASADDVFWLTHEQLGLVVAGKGEALMELARARAGAQPWQMTLDFPELSHGLPEPTVASADEGGEGELRGKPVSHGVVRGRARVVKTLAEAHAIEPGEILIAPITDVGWTPYFSTIAGLATDLGSAVSHGAVVAREYGLPAVVNLRRATASFRTGQQVELDGVRGVLRCVD